MTRYWFLSYRGKKKDGNQACANSVVGDAAHPVIIVRRWEKEGWNDWQEIVLLYYQELSKEEFEVIWKEVQS